MPWTGSRYWNNLHGVLGYNLIVQCEVSVWALLQLCLGEHKRAGSELGKPNFLCWGQVNGILESLYCSCFGLSEQHSTITGPRITRSTKLWFVQNCSFSLAKEGASKEIPWLCLRKVDCYSLWGVWEWAVNDAKIQKNKKYKKKK